MAHPAKLAPLAAALLFAGNAVAQDHAHPPAPTAQEDHSQHQAPKRRPAPKPKPQPPPEEHDHAAMGHDTPPDQPITPIPTVTDADRAAAAGPSGHGHAMHDDMWQQRVLLDRLEGFGAGDSHGLEWELEAWWGTDLHKLRLRSEGEHIGGNTEDADIEVLYGRAIAPWWDVVAGVRHHLEPGGSQDQVVLGVMGTTKYKFEVNASLYVGGSGYTGARLEVEYDTLLTNRLVLQPALEANLHGRDDPAHGNGSGLGTVEAGLRLRYEFTRRFAPYVGFVHERAFGRTADLRRAEGEDIDDTRLVAGVRLWF